MTKQENFDEVVKRFDKMFNATLTITKTEYGMSETNPRTCEGNGFNDGVMFVKHYKYFRHLDSNYMFINGYLSIASGNQYYDIYRAILNSHAPWDVVLLLESFRSQNWIANDSFNESDIKKAKVAKQVLKDIKKFVNSVCYHYDVYYYIAKNGEKVLTLDDRKGKLVGSFVYVLRDAVVRNGNETVKNGKFTPIKQVALNKIKHQLKRCNDYINHRFYGIKIQDKETGDFFSRSEFIYPLIESDVIPALNILEQRYIKRGLRKDI